LTSVSIHGPQSPGWRPRTRTRSQPVFRRLSPPGPPIPRHARLLRTLDPGYQAVACRTHQGLAIPGSPPCGGRLLRTSATKPFAFVWTLSLRVSLRYYPDRITSKRAARPTICFPTRTPLVESTLVLPTQSLAPCLCCSRFGKRSRIFRTKMVGQARRPIPISHPWISPEHSAANASYSRTNAWRPLGRSVPGCRHTT